MKKLFLCAALAASFGMIQPANAVTVTDANAVSSVLSIGDYEGTYNGTMDKIIMMGKEYEARPATYTLENGKLHCDFPQLGAMPGTITIDLTVKVDEETGAITAHPNDQAGTLTIPGMDPITLYLTSLDDAQITGNQIEFTLNVLGSYEDILEYEATVHFVGTK